MARASMKATRLRSALFEVRSVGGATATLIRPRVMRTPAWAGTWRAKMRNVTSVAATRPLTLPSPASGARVPLFPLPCGERAGVRVLENNGRLMHTEDGPQGVADLAEGDSRPHRVEDEGHQVVPAARGAVDGLEGLRGAARVAGGAQTPDTLSHGLTYRGVDLEEMAGGRLIQDEVVDAHHDARPGLDLLLIAIG